MKRRHRTAYDIVYVVGRRAISNKRRQALERLRRRILGSE